LEIIKKDKIWLKNTLSRWLAIKLVEKDEQILDIIKNSKILPELMEAIA
jgi:hypothetical protein